MYIIYIYIYYIYMPIFSKNPGTPKSTLFLRSQCICIHKGNNHSDSNRKLLNALESANMLLKLQIQNSNKDEQQKVCFKAKFQLFKIERA